MADLVPSVVSIAFHGAAYGMVLYVISVGLSITMGLMGFVNLAHGAFAMTGGLAMATATTLFGAPFPLGLLLAFAVTAGVSAVLERSLYARLYQAGELAQVLFTMGLIFVSIALARLAYGTLTVPIALPPALGGQIELIGRPFPAYKVFVILAGCVMFAALWYVVERTRFGAMVRAAVDDAGMAQSIGIDVRRLFTLTFALGSGLAGLGGALGADLLPIHWSYPVEHLVFFMIVVAVGGLGNLHGPFFAALLIGIADTACKYWLFINGSPTPAYSETNWAVIDRANGFFMGGGFGRGSGVGWNRAIAERSPELIFLYSQIKALNPGFNSHQMRDESVKVYPKDLEGFSIPTLISGGSHDDFLNPESHFHVATLIPGAQTYTFENAGHSAYFETPGEFNEVLSRFLDQNVA